MLRSICLGCDDFSQYDCRLGISFGSFDATALASLSAITAFAAVVNVAITGVLSMPEDRFECRVIWMVPLLAEMFALAWLTRSREFAETSKTASGS